MLKRLSDLFAPYGVQVAKNVKRLINGEDVEQFLFKKPEEEAGPTIDKNVIDNFFDNDKEKEFVEQVLLIVNDAKNQIIGAEKIVGLLKNGGDIMPCAVNTAANKALLDRCLHREVLDMSIIYRLVLKEDNEGLQSTVITTDFAERVGITEEELFLRAKEYVCENARCATLFDLLLCGRSKVPLNEYSVEDAMAGEDGMNIMLTLSYGGSLYGAGIMAMWADENGGCAPEWMRGRVVLPSSIHEAFVVLTDEVENDALLEMVHSVNCEQVDREERLSNSVYEITADGKLAIRIKGEPLVA